MSLRINKKRCATVAEKPSIFWSQVRQHFSFKRVRSGALQTFISVIVLLWKLLKEALNKHKTIRNFGQLKEIFQIESKKIGQFSPTASSRFWCFHFLKVIRADGRHIE
jgi:hypothetical protein